MPTTVTSTPEELRDTDMPAAKRERKAFPWDYVAIFLVILLISGIRFRLRDFPLERDEGEYAYAGQLILQGIPPYQLAYNMKLPGTYAAYAVIMAVFGQTCAGIHLGLIVVNSASIFLLFLVVKRLFDPTVAVVAGATFGLFTIRPLVLGLAAHATHFVTLFALLAIYLLLKALGTDRLWLFFGSGLCFGLAFLMKQPGIFFGLFGGLYLCWCEWAAAQRRSAFFRKLGTFSAGAILPYGLTCLILWRAGVFAKFWFWTVSYARAYGSEQTPWKGLQQLANRVELQKEHIAFFFFLTVFGMASFLWNRKARPHALFILGLLGSSFLAISVGLYFRGHYFLMLYPVLALLIGVGTSTLGMLFTRLGLGRVGVVIPVALVALNFAWVLYVDRSLFFYDSPRDACRYVYGLSPFPEAIQVADYIQNHSFPDSKVAVIGSEPEIYFYAHRHSATGYIYSYPLVENQQYSSMMQGDLIREVESARPEIIVYVVAWSSWDTHVGTSTRIFEWIDAYLKEHYSLDGIADGGNHDVYRWGRDSWSYRPRKPDVLVVFRRAD